MKIRPIEGVDPRAAKLAEEMSAEGYDKEKYAAAMSQFDESQKKGFLRSVFDKIFLRKKNKIAIDGFKVKHGRGDELNADIVYQAREAKGVDPYDKAGVSINRQFFKSEVPMSKTQKMAYSSVQEEDMRKKKEKKGRDQEFQQLANVTATDMDGTLLGATQTLELNGIS